MPLPPLFAVDVWPLGGIVLAAALGLASVYLLLPRPRNYPVTIAGLLGLLALLVTGMMLSPAGFTPETVLFYAFAAIAIISGVLLVTQRNPARAALSFALVVLSTCGLFLLQAAPFLMAATVIIYAGAIIVTFLFVIMLAQQEGVSDADNRSREPLFSAFAGFALLATLLYVLNLTYGTEDLDSHLHEVEQLRDAVADLHERAERGDSVDASRTLSQGSQVLERFAGWVNDGLRGSPEGTERLRNAAEGALQVLHEAMSSGQRSHNPREDVPKSLAHVQKSLANLHHEGVEVRSHLGQLEPHRGRVLSRFSGPPPNLDWIEQRRDETGQPEMPAENVAYLGRSLFTDYLLAVELGGTLLLVATVGAIAIASRRGGKGVLMNPVPIHYYLAVGAILFALGLIGFLARRNLIIMFLSAEMMLQGVAVNLVAFARYRGNLHGQVFTLFIITVAACEAAIALALILMLFRSKQSLDVSLWQDLREPGQPATVDEEPLPPATSEAPLPKLTPAGLEPQQREETSHV